MVRYNPLSALRNIDLDNFKAIRRIMNVLAWGLRNPGVSISLEIAVEHGILFSEQGPVDRILRSIERNPDYPLLRLAVERFIQARDKGEVDIMLATREFEHLGEERELLSPITRLGAYEAAWERFQDLPPVGTRPQWEDTEGNYGQGGSQPMLRKDSGLGGLGTPGRRRSSQRIATTSGQPMTTNDSNTPQIPEVPVDSSPNAQEDESAPFQASQRICSPHIHTPPNIQTSQKPQNRSRTPLPDRPTILQGHSNDLSFHPGSSFTPINAVLPISTPKKRGKTPVACDECRRRKIKCERKQGSTQCNSCIGLACRCRPQYPSNIAPPVALVFSPLTPTPSNAASSTPIFSSLTPTKSGKLRACNECKRRKIKCETANGCISCHHCIKIGGDCIRSEFPSSRSPAKSSSRSPLKSSVGTKIKSPWLKKQPSSKASSLDDFDDMEEAVLFAGVSGPEDNDYNPDKRHRKRMRAI